MKLIVTIEDESDERDFGIYIWNVSITNRAEIARAIDDVLRLRFPTQLTPPTKEQHDDAYAKQYGQFENSKTGGAD